MRSQLIIATTLFLSGTFAWGQELSKRWSLEECIRYAIEHNIDLKQKRAGSGKPESRIAYQ